MAASLRRTLIDLVIAAAPLAALGCDAVKDDECTRFRERSVRLPEPPPEALEMLVRACEADAQTCLELCESVLSPTEQFEGLVTMCEVEHDANGHDVHVGWVENTYASGCPVPGRRPPGLREATRRPVSVVAGHLAQAAWFEAASVHAFVGLARELARRGAPAMLWRGAQRAALEEVHHAQLMGRSARARGATPPPVEVAAPRRRSLEALAIENATEGVVGETWSALLAYWQARHAPDPALRAIYATIADDELRHAELAREVDAWCQAQLRPAARRRVELARRRAVARLARSVRNGPPAALVEEVGMPARAAMQRLFTGARAQLWPA